MLGRVDNLHVVVEDWPTREQDPNDEGILGIYEGVSLLERGDWYSGALPDRIVIFMGPHLDLDLSPANCAGRSAAPSSTKWPTTWGSTTPAWNNSATTERPAPGRRHLSQARPRACRCPRHGRRPGRRPLPLLRAATAPTTWELGCSSPNCSAATGPIPPAICW